MSDSYQEQSPLFAPSLSKKQATNQMPPSNQLVLNQPKANQAASPEANPVASAQVQEPVNSMEVDSDESDHQLSVKKAAKKNKTTKNQDEKRLTMSKLTMNQPIMTIPAVSNESFFSALKNTKGPAGKPATGKTGDMQHNIEMADKTAPATDMTFKRKREESGPISQLYINNNDEPMDQDPEASGSAKKRTKAEKQTKEEHQLEKVAEVFRIQNAKDRQAKLDQNKYQLGYALVCLALPNLGLSSMTEIISPLQRPTVDSHAQTLLNGIFYRNVPEYAVRIVIDSALIDKDCLQLAAVKPEGGFKPLKLAENLPQGMSLTYTLLAGGHRRKAVQLSVAPGFRLYQNLALQVKNAPENAAKRNALERSQKLLYDNPNAWFLAVFHDSAAIEKDTVYGPAIKLALGRNVSVQTQDSPQHYLYQTLKAMVDADQAQGQKEVRAQASVSQSQRDTSELSIKHPEVMQTWAMLGQIPNFLDRTLHPKDVLASTHVLWGVLAPLLKGGYYQMLFLVDENIDLSAMSWSQLQMMSMVSPELIAAKLEPMRAAVRGYTPSQKIGRILIPLLQMVLAACDNAFETHLNAIMRFWALPNNVRADEDTTSHSEWQEPFELYVKEIYEESEVQVQAWLNENLTLSATARKTAKTMPLRLRLLCQFAFFEKVLAPHGRDWPIFSPKFLHAVWKGELLPMESGLKLVAHIFQPALSIIAKRRRTKPEQANIDSIPFKSVTDSIHYKLRSDHPTAAEKDIASEAAVAPLWHSIILLLLRHRRDTFLQCKIAIEKVLGKHDEAQGVLVESEVKGLLEIMKLWSRKARRDPIAKEFPTRVHRCERDFPFGQVEVKLTSKKTKTLPQIGVNQSALLTALLEVPWNFHHTTQATLYNTKLIEAIGQDLSFMQQSVQPLVATEVSLRLLLFRIQEFVRAAGYKKFAFWQLELIKPTDMELTNVSQDLIRRQAALQEAQVRTVALFETLEHCLSNPVYGGLQICYGSKEQVHKKMAPHIAKAYNEFVCKVMAQSYFVNAFNAGLVPRTMAPDNLEDSDLEHFGNISPGWVRKAEAVATDKMWAAYKVKVESSDTDHNATAAAHKAGQDVLIPDREALDRQIIFAESEDGDDGSDMDIDNDSKPRKGMSKKAQGKQRAA